MMEFNEFANHIKKNILQYLPEELADSNVKLVNVNKTNGIEKLSLNIMQPNKNIAPNIYLDEFYERYLEGRDLVTTMKLIAEKQKEALERTPENLDEFLTDFANVESKIQIGVMNAEGNERLLENIPHRIENDLAIYYKIVISENDGETVSTKITNQICNMYNTNENTLNKIALSNSEKNNPVTLYSMESKLFREILGDEKAENLMESSTSIDNPEMMYILSTEAVNNGAAALFYAGVKESIAEKLGGDYYVLPSSVDEVLIVKKQPSLNADMLKEMVGDVNANPECISKELILSNNVYSYDSKTKELSIANGRSRVLCNDDINKIFEQKKSGSGIDFQL